MRPRGHRHRLDGCRHGPRSVHHSAGLRGERLVVQEGANVVRGGADAVVGGPLEGRRVVAGRDAVGVAVAVLHDVAEHEGIDGARARVVGRLPGGFAERELELGDPRHRHRRVEGGGEFDGLGPSVGVGRAPSRRGQERGRGHRQRRELRRHGPRAVHPVPGPGVERVVVEDGVFVDRGRPDVVGGPQPERGPLAVHGDAVGVAVVGLHRVAEHQRVGGARARVVGRAPGALAERELELGHPRHRHRRVEGGGDVDRLPAPVRVRCACSRRGQERGRGHRHRHDRGRSFQGPQAVHLVVGPRAERRVVEDGGEGVLGGADAVVGRPHEGRRVVARLDAVGVEVAVVHDVAEHEGVGGARARVVGRLPGRLAEGEPDLRGSRHRHRCIEGGGEFDGLAPSVGVGARRAGRAQVRPGGQRKRRGRCGHGSRAVHPVPGLGVERVVVEDGAHFVRGGADAVVGVPHEGRRVVARLDAAGVAVAALHDVAEHEGVGGARARVVGRPPGGRADRELERRVPRHRHRCVEGGGEFDGLAPSVGVGRARPGRGHQRRRGHVHVRERRRRGRRAVHPVAGLCAERIVVETGGPVARRGEDGVVLVHLHRGRQPVRLDAVGIAVAVLHDVAEHEGLGGARARVVGCPPGVAAGDHELDLRVPRHRHRLAERDRELDFLGSPVGVGHARPGRGQPRRRADRERGDRCDRRRHAHLVAGQDAQLFMVERGPQRAVRRSLDSVVAVQREGVRLVAHLDAVGVLVAILHGVAEHRRRRRAPVAVVDRLPGGVADTEPEHRVAHHRHRRAEGDGELDRLARSVDVRRGGARPGQHRNRGQRYRLDDGSGCARVAVDPDSGGMGVASEPLETASVPDLSPFVVVDSPTVQTAVVLAARIRRDEVAPRAIRIENDVIMLVRDELDSVSRRRERQGPVSTCSEARRCIELIGRSPIAAIDVDAQGGAGGPQILELDFDAGQHRTRVVAADPEPLRNVIGTEV